MTTYIDGKAVGVGTIRAEIGVSGDVLHDSTLKGNGNTEPLGVDTEVLKDKLSFDVTYVKKSGDTMTGDLAFEDYSAEHPQKHVLHGDSSFSIEYYYNNEQRPRQTWNFAGASLFASTTTGVKPFLGHPTHPWDNIYAKKLNNGADITIPTLGGTLARIEDLQNATATLNAGITGNAQAIQKTREDYMDADTDIMTIVNAHASELTTQRNDIGGLGDQVSNIESKIPETASGNNPLITKQQLLDEEMDIRSDLIDIQGELQTQITAQATEIAGKQDKLTAGSNITIVDNVISAKGTQAYTPTVPTVDLQDNSIFNFTDDALATLSISVPETINADFACQVNFSSGTTATAFTAPDTIKWAGDDIVSGAFVPVASKRYAILFYSDGSNLRAISQGVE